MNKSQTIYFIIGLFVSTTIFAAQGMAHDLWTTMDNYRIDPGRTAGAGVYSSHHFQAPEADLMPIERMAQFLFVSPDGRQTMAANSGQGVYDSKSVLKKTGTYLAVALPVNGFATKTPEGYQRGKSRKDVEKPIACSYSQKFAKAVFSVGQSGGDAYSKPLGHAMEIVPLKDPSTLQAGAVLPVQVLLEGKPMQTIVFGTYAGFSENSNTFAYATRSNKDGIAEIKMIHDGIWVLIAKAEDSYPDMTECDKQRWAASLTFEIR